MAQRVSNELAQSVPQGLKRPSPIYTPGIGLARPFIQGMLWTGYVLVGYTGSRPSNLDIDLPPQG